MSEISQGSLIIKYEKILATHPKSQVFAPLSESYTQMGLFDKAMKVLKKGIRYNPNYTLGYISLAKCYEAQGEHQLAYSTLRPLVAQNRDNIKLQILFSKVSMNTQNFDEALDTYKYLHFLNPNDEHVTSKIEEIEEKIKSEAPIEKEKNVKFDINEINVEDEDIESWEQADFSSLNEEYDSDEWSVTPDSNDEVMVETNSDDTDGAMFTHTLVDLYLSQGHKDKALDILKKILELKPGNEKAMAKISELENKEEITVNEVVKDIIKDDGHADLSASLDKLTLADDDFEPNEKVNKGSAVNNETVEALKDLSLLIKQKSLSKISH